MPPADLVLANRSYLDHAATPGEGGDVPAAGGLLASVGRVLVPWDGQEGTTWIGAGRGRFDRQFVDADGRERLTIPGGALDHRRLFFDEATWRGHYVEVANGYLWPLLHLVNADLPARAIGYPAPALPSASAWAHYVAVNEAFARAALSARTSGTAWIHDYQLALVPQMLRDRSAPFRIGFFLHTPVPHISFAAKYGGPASVRAFAAVLRGMLGADLIGFQTAGDLARFRTAATELCGASVGEALETDDGRPVAVGVFPVGIDSDAVLNAIPTSFSTSDLPLVIGLERCDFTKGIPERLRCAESARRAGLAFCYSGVAARTREDVPAYAAYAAAVDSEARRWNAAESGSFGQRFLTLPWSEVVALEVSADVVFAASLSDGMNLVPLQAAIAQSRRPPGERAALIAGRDTGVVAAFGADNGEGITSVNPLDPIEMQAVLGRAVRGELPRVSDTLIQSVRENSAASWASRFLSVLEDTA